MSRFEWVVLRSLWFLIRATLGKVNDDNVYKAGQEAIADIEQLFKQPKKEWRGPQDDMFN